MDPAKLPKSVLVALGLTAAAQPGCGVLGPCLDIAVETDTDPGGTDPDTDTDSDSDSDSDTTPVDTGPCLDFAVESIDTRYPDQETAQGNTIGTPADRVLQRGVLPEDVAALLRQRREPK
jgi:hypothetical protein